MKKALQIILALFASLFVFIAIALIGVPFALQESTEGTADLYRTVAAVVALLFFLFASYRIIKRP